MRRRGWDLRVFGDREKTEQILVNLLTNAVKFTPPGGKITVVCGRVGDEVAIGVQDSGIGIALEQAVRPEPDRRPSIYCGRADFIGADAV